MNSNNVDCERVQAFCFRVNLRAWIPEDDLTHFVIEAVERVDMSAFRVNHRGTGSAQYQARHEVGAEVSPAMPSRRMSGRR